MRFKYIRLFLLFFYTILPLGATEKKTIERIIHNSTFTNPIVNVKKTPTDSSTVMPAVHIHYRVNRTDVERNYMDNAYALGVIDQIFTNHAVDDIDYILVTGNASPEGNVQHNNRLAEQRALAFKNYLLSNYPGLREDRIHTISKGEDWDGLATIIEYDGKVPYRKELLDLLKSKLPREEQKKRMKALGNGQSYTYLQKHVLPRLRGGVSGMIYFKKDTPQVVIQTDTVEKTRVDTVYLEKIVYTPREVIVYDTVYKKVEKKPFFIAVKNNMLYDVVLLPNLSVEVPFGRNYEWSAVVEGNWSWWNTGADKYNYHRIQMAGVEMRRWFGNKTGNPLNGWYAGVYGYGGDYDIRLFTDKNSDTGQQSLWSYSAGLTIGYAIPVGRRFNLEFGLGVGYFGGKYKKYTVSNCQDGVFPLLSTHRRTYFGPTKAGVSLVWLIGSGVNNKKRKEEAR